MTGMHANPTAAIGRPGKPPRRGWTDRGRSRFAGR